MVLARPWWLDNAGVLHVEPPGGGGGGNRPKPGNGNGKGNGGANWPGGGGWGKGGKKGGDGEFTLASIFPVSGIMGWNPVTDNNNISFGDEHPDRILAAVWSWGKGGTTSDVSSVSIGGVAATKRVEASAVAGFNNVEIWTAPVPTGTSGAVRATFNNSTGTDKAAVVALFRLVGYPEVPSYMAVFDGITAVGVSNNVSHAANAGVVCGIVHQNNSSGLSVTGLSTAAVGSRPGLSYSSHAIYYEKKADAGPTTVTTGAIVNAGHRVVWAAWNPL